MIYYNLNKSGLSQGFDTQKAEKGIAKLCELNWLICCVFFLWYLSEKEGHMWPPGHQLLTLALHLYFSRVPVGS